jgi:hypothetical protein
VPSRFRHFHHLYARYKSWDKTRAYLVDQRTDDLLGTIYPQDKVKNADGHRRALQTSINNKPSSDIEKDLDPIPPLLRKILSDYAATGLPPAYLPMESMNTKNKENKDE